MEVVILSTFSGLIVHGLFSFCQLFVLYFMLPNNNNNERTLRSNL